ncbi:SigE family RNA polymerase sigma factor [Streptomyces sp. NPDC088745]|uniref:SigE family RNA polymerase sigma factor n=1 Tax=Streptomyces sp. NPDC088745 TaxID=3365884 RepID=UPI00380FABCC
MASWESVVGELVETRASALHRYGFLLCGNRTDASDLVQEALVRVFARPRLSWNVASVEGYVRTVMLNYFFDTRRRRRNLQELTPKIAESPSKDDISGNVDSRVDLISAMAGLSPRQRACIVLRYYEDQSVAGIATLLDCSEGAVKRYLSDGLKRLNDTLGGTLGEICDTPEGGVRQ